MTFFRSISENNSEACQTDWGTNSGTFERDDFAGRVHDGAVGRDRPADGVGRVAQVDDDHLVLLAHLLSDADEAIRLHGQAAEADPGGTHSQRLQLRETRTLVNAVHVRAARYWREVR